MQGFYRRLAVLGVFLLGLTGCGGGDSGNGSMSTLASVGATTTVATTNERATFTAFTMAFTIRELDDGCEPIDFGVTVSGSATDTDNLNPSNSISMAISAPGWVLDVVSMAGGASLTLNGTVSIVSSCFTGDVTLETIIPLFFPDDGSDCPTAGEIVLTGDQSATLAFTASGGLAVDEGSNGTIDVTFVDCEDAESCM